MANHILQDFQIDRCCGCLSCIHSCPTGALIQSKDAYGFTVPQIRLEQCIHCGQCVSACPYHGEIKENLPRHAYAALHKNDQVVTKSSSGGIFAALAEHILQHGGCVFGATMDDDFQVKHICVEDMKDLHLIQRSKYVQSDMHGIYPLVREKLSQGCQVLFSGTPCQVAGLRTFLRDKDCEHLVCVDVVCHGVPNQSLFDDYLSCLTRKVGCIDQYMFRAKRTAKNGMNWFFSYRVEGKKPVVRNWPEDSYNYLYMKSLTYRESCYSCRFAKRERASDITLCDYWSWDTYHAPDFAPMSTVSGCIVNTDKGEALLRAIQSQINCIPTSYDDLARHNKCLVSSTPLNAKRQVVLDLWKNEGYECLDRRFKEKMKKQILKYRLMRHIPERVLWELTHTKKNN